MSGIIRAYELKKGDLFKKQGTIYLVNELTDVKIIYSYYWEDLKSGGGNRFVMGRRSQERVEYVGEKPKKKKTKPFKNLKQIV
jgi:hypothetical protein